MMKYLEMNIKSKTAHKMPQTTTTPCIVKYFLVSLPAER